MPKSDRFKWEPCREENMAGCVDIIDTQVSHSHSIAVARSICDADRIVKALQMLYPETPPPTELDKDTPDYDAPDYSGVPVFDLLFGRGTR